MTSQVQAGGTISTTRTGASVPAAPGATPIVAATKAVPVRRPGRWVGGLVGALASFAVAWIGLANGEPIPWEDGGFSLDGIVGIGLMGMPVGFVLGRAFLPLARTGGWLEALGVGLLVGVLAPPLGSLVVLGSLLLDGGVSGSVSPEDLAMVLYLVPIAAVVSYIAVVATIPAGLAWAVVLRLLPDGLLEAVAVPPPLDRIGVRHALLVGAAFVGGVLAWESTVAQHLERGFPLGLGR